MTLSDFCLIWIVAYLFGVMLWATQKSESRWGASSGERRKKLWAIGGSTSLWLVITGLAAHEGLLVDVTQTPPPVALLLVPSLLLVLAIVMSPIGARLAQGLTYPQLVGFQVFRLPVELVLYGYFLEGQIPESMTFAGRNWDVLTALSAVVLVPLISFGIAGKRVIWIWNAAGLVLLLNVLTIAVLSLPGRWQLDTLTAANTLPFRWPSVWILFCVLAALLGHLLVFRRLLRRQQY